MIRSIKILDIDNTAVKWISNIPAFTNQSEWEFSPGLNILWGLNGCGKSTLLRLLARMFHSEHGQDEQKLTSRSIEEMFYRTSNNNYYKRIPSSRYDSVAVEHDGSPVSYFDSAVGKGMSLPGAFDDNFFKDSFANHTFRGSAGETTANRMVNIARNIVSGKFPELTSAYVNDMELYKDELDKFFAGTLEKDRPTVLLDEPERSLDIVNQVAFWSFVQKFKNQVQFIIASHSLFACDLDANYISFGSSEYLEECRLIKKTINQPDIATAYAMMFLSKKNENVQV